MSEGSRAILVVDDDEDIRAVLHESLAAEGHAVVASDFGALPLGPFSIVLTDMPRWPYDAEDGRRWVRYLRQRYESARIMLCTAQHLVHRESDSLGADEIVDKPFDLADLFERVANLQLAGAPLRRSLAAG